MTLPKDGNIEKVRIQHYRIPETYFVKYLENKYEDDPDRYKGKPHHWELTKYSKNSDPKWLKWEWDWGFEDEKPYPKGGATICIIKTKDGRSHFGIARCSFSENFCYKEGRNKAYGFAVQAMVHYNAVAKMRREENILIQKEADEFIQRMREVGYASTPKLK